jgi:hypothetical protein
MPPAAFPFSFKKISNNTRTNSAEYDCKRVASKRKHIDFLVDFPAKIAFRSCVFVYIHYFSGHISSLFFFDIILHDCCQCFLTKTKPAGKRKITRGLYILQKCIPLQKGRGFFFPGLFSFRKPENFPKKSYERWRAKMRLSLL